MEKKKFDTKVRAAQRQTTCKKKVIQQGSELTNSENLNQVAGEALESGKLIGVLIIQGEEAAAERIKLKYLQNSVGTAIWLTVMMDFGQG